MFLIASYHNDVSLRLTDCSAVPQVIASKTEFFFLRQMRQKTLSGCIATFPLSNLSL